MPLFLPPPGPGPLVQSPHSRDAGGVVPGAYAFLTQGRPVAFYRGSYSLNASAADELGPGITWASTTASRAVANYQAAKPSVMSVFASSTPLDSYAPVSLERGVANYRAPGSQIINSGDQPGPGLEYAPRADSVPVPFYKTPRSQTISPPPFTQVLDTWAATTFGRSAPFYTGSRAVTISVWDPATNTFADWTPAALLSRSVQNYRPPAAQPRITWGQDIITDQFAPLISSRLVPFYRPQPSVYTSVFDQPAALFGSDWASVTQTWRAPLRYQGAASITIPVWDPATNTFADWVAQPTASRAVPFYRAPASLLASLYDQPAAAFGTTWASVAQTWRGVPFYRGSYSLNANAADQDFVGSTTDFAAPILSRPVALYTAPRSIVVNGYLNTFYGTETAAAYQNRKQPWYAPLAARSLVILVFDGPAGNGPLPPPPVPPDPYAPNLPGYGGGGFGAVMADDFFKRYDARYKPRYVGRYKPSIRKQK